jgi:hypothetical protein
MEQANRAVDLDPAFLLPRFAQGWINIAAGKIGDAIPELQEANVRESPSFVAGWLGYAYGATGDRTRAMAVIEELNRKSMTDMFRRSIWPLSISVWATAGARWTTWNKHIQRTLSGYAGSRWIAFSILCEKSHVSSR